jgi:hypothetical protein
MKMTLKLLPPFEIGRENSILLLQAPFDSVADGLVLHVNPEKS